MNDIELQSLKALAGESSVNPRQAWELLDETGACADDLEDPNARALWAALEAAVRNGEPIDPLVLSERACVPRALAVDVVVGSTLGVTRQRFELLRQCSLRRQYLEALRQVARVVTDRSQPLANGVAEAGRLLATWQDEKTSIRPLDEALVGLCDELEEVAAGRRAPTLATGIDSLDAVIGGLQPTLTVIGSEPGVGKSALVAGICRQLGARGVTIGVLSLEDERGWLPRRLMANAAQVPVFVLANQRLHAAQQDRISNAAQPLQHMLSHILCDDRPGLTTADVVASARKMIARGAKAVIIDHLGEIRLDRSDRHDLDISDCLRDLRTVAKMNRVPVVVFAHMKRLEGAEPKLTDFAYSAGIERMARVALGLYKTKDGDVRAAVLKQTQGVAGLSVPLVMHRSSGVIIESPASEAAQALYEDQS